MAFYLFDGFFVKVDTKNRSLVDAIRDEIDKEILRIIIRCAKLENTAVDEDGNVIEGTAPISTPTCEIDDLDWLRE